MGRKPVLYYCNRGGLSTGGKWRGMAGGGAALSGMRSIGRLRQNKRRFALQLRQTQRPPGGILAGKFSQKGWDKHEGARSGAPAGRPRGAGGRKRRMGRTGSTGTAVVSCRAADAAGGAVRADGALRCGSDRRRRGVDAAGGGRGGSRLPAGRAGGAAAALYRGSGPGCRHPVGAGSGAGAAGAAVCAAAAGVCLHHGHRAADPGADRAGCLAGAVDPGGGGSGGRLCRVFRRGGGLESGLPCSNAQHAEPSPADAGAAGGADPDRGGGDHGGLHCHGAGIFPRPHGGGAAGAGAGTLRPGGRRLHGRGHHGRGGGRGRTGADSAGHCHGFRRADCRGVFPLWPGGGGADLFCGGRRGHAGGNRFCCPDPPVRDRRRRSAAGAAAEKLGPAAGASVYPQP